MGAPENKRKTNRLYAIKPTQIKVEGIQYTLNDISEAGLGIIVDGPHTFSMGQRIDAITLELNDRTVLLKGAVAHVDKTASSYICGIRFIFSGIEEYNFVAQFKKSIGVIS